MPHHPSQEGLKRKQTSPLSASFGSSNSKPKLRLHADEPPLPAFYYLPNPIHTFTGSPMQNEHLMRARREEPAMTNPTLRVLNQRGIPQCARPNKRLDRNPSFDLRGSSLNLLSCFGVTGCGSGSLTLVLEVNCVLATRWFHIAQSMPEKTWQKRRGGVFQLCPQFPWYAEL